MVGAQWAFKRSSNGINKHWKASPKAIKLSCDVKPKKKKKKTLIYIKLHIIWFNYVNKHIEKESKELLVIISGR